MAKQVLYGRTHRIHIRVEDYTEGFETSALIQKHCADMIANGKQLMFIIVYALSHAYDKYTSYSMVGRHVYYGHKLEEAIDAIKPYMDGEISLSKKLEKYREINWLERMEHVLNTINQQA